MNAKLTALDATVEYYTKKTQEAIRKRDFIIEKQSVFDITSKIVDMAIANLEPWDHAMESALGLDSYIHEYRTIRISLPRQTGQSYKLQELYDKNPEGSYSIDGNPIFGSVVGLHESSIETQMRGMASIDCVLIDNFAGNLNYGMTKVNREKFFVLKMGTYV